MEQSVNADYEKCLFALKESGDASIFQKYSDHTYLLGMNISLQEYLIATETNQRF